MAKELRYRFQTRLADFIIKNNPYWNLIAVSVALVTMSIRTTEIEIHLPKSGSLFTPHSRCTNFLTKPHCEHWTLKEIENITFLSFYRAPAHVRYLSRHTVYADPTEISQLQIKNIHHVRIYDGHIRWYYKRIH